MVKQGMPDTSGLEKQAAVSGGQQEEVLQGASWAPAFAHQSQERCTFRQRCGDPVHQTADQPCFMLLLLFYCGARCRPHHVPPPR